MMKNYITFCLLLTFICSSLTVNSQNVGINTTTPRTTLEVAGDVEILENIDIGTINPVTDTDINTFLVQGSSGKIKSIVVNHPTGAALGYIQEYIITNPDQDWVLDFDTGLDATEFVLITTSANFDTELLLSSSAGAEDNASLPYTATFIQGGTWHIIADYPMAANDPTTTGTWTISTLIYSRDLLKQFSSMNIPMGGASTGSASTPILD